MILIEEHWFRQGRLLRKLISDAQLIASPWEWHGRGPRAGGSRVHRPGWGGEEWGGRGRIGMLRILES